MSPSEQEPIGAAKEELRKRIAAARAALRADIAEGFSLMIQARLLVVPEVRSTAAIFTYVSQGSEVITRELIQAFLGEGRTVTVPLITGDGVMEAHRISQLDDLAPGRFGILAPREKNPWSGPIEVVIAPGVAFTLRGDRLGRGKGYYDRFLAAHPGSFTIGLGFELQVVEEIPVLPTDQRLDMVITEKRTIRVAR